MTTVQITLPDELAQKASDAGLFSPGTIADILREQLRRQAIERLRQFRAAMPDEELTPEIEQMIVDEVKAYRAEKRQREAKRSGPNIPRWVLDTNTVIAGLLWNGTPARLLDLAEAGNNVCWSSPALIDELTRVLGYRKFAGRLAQSGNGFDDWVRPYKAAIELVEPSTLPRIVERDPDDDHVIACAVAGHADAIVSGDRHLLDLGEHKGIAIVTAADAFKRLV